MAWYRTGGGGLPSSLVTDMNAVLNKKMGTSTTYPWSQWADTVNLLGKLPEATKSGTIVHFADGADRVPIKNLVANIPANLEGVSSVEVVQTGKNLLDDSKRVLTNHNIVFGRSSGGRDDYTMTLKAGTYTFSVVTADGEPTNLYIKDTDINTNIVTGISKLSLTFTLNEPKNISAFVYKPTYTSIDDIISAQIEVDSTATSYEPYIATTHTVSLGQTVYGGSADIVTGEGESLCDKYNVTGQETGDFLAGNNNNGNRIGLSGFSLAQKPLYSDGVSNIGVNKACLNSATWTIGSWCIYTDNKLYFVVPNEYTTFSTALQYLVDNNATFVFPLATPTDFAFTPITPTPETKLGANTIWNDAGDTSVTYRRDIELALSAGAPLMMMASRPPIQEQPQEEEESTDESI